MAIVQTIPHPVISSSARDPLFPAADCNISVSLNKSLRQIANPSYNVHVENHVQALTKSACFFAPISRCPRRICDILRTRAAYKAFVSYSLHTLQNAPLATNVFSITCTLSEKQRGVWGGEVYKRLPILGTPPYSHSRDRFPDRGPFPKVLARLRPTNSPSPTHGRESHPKIATASRPAHSTFTCNKKAIYSKLTPNRRKRTESEQRLQGIPQGRIVPQEN